MIKETLMQRIQSLTAEDMQILDDVLTPSVSNVLNKIVPEIEPLLTEFTQDDERQNFAVGGPIDFSERAKQSQADFIARQPGATLPPTQTPFTTTPAASFNFGESNPGETIDFRAGTNQNTTTNPAPTPQPKPNFPKPFPMTEKEKQKARLLEEAKKRGILGPLVPFGPKPAGMSSQPFDMSKYQGGTFTGGIEDSRNIALNELASLGVDIDKYRTMSAKKDPTAPTFQGYTNMEIMVMSPEEAKQKLGFDPSVQGANPEFEKFIQSEFDRTGPMAIGPSGPVGVRTEFKNQDELAQILNRAIPFYMRTARDLGENYTLEEMLAMSDEELAALDDRYDKKMGYGKYAKRPANTQTGSTDKSQVQETMEYYSGNIQPQGTGIGLGSQYSTGGRVGFRYGGDDARIKKYMKPSYRDPFGKLSNVDKRRFDAFNRLVLGKGRKMISTDKKKKRNLLTLNEQARAKALQRLNILKKLYGRG